MAVTEPKFKRGDRFAFHFDVHHVGFDPDPGATTNDLKYWLKILPNDAVKLVERNGEVFLVADTEAVDAVGTAVAQPMEP